MSSCLGIALTKIELAPRLDLISAIMVFCDLKKAFNSISRSTLVREAQRICGAGRLMMTRFMGRTYTFEGKVRGQDANRGVDAGTPLSVWGFGNTINTDHSTTTVNKGLLCHPNYSDDRNVTGSGTYVESGLFQKGLCCKRGLTRNSSECEWEQNLRAQGENAHPCAYCYSLREGLEFHETGKKKPEALCFTQKVKKGRKSVETKIPDGATSLFLGSTDIKLVDRQKVLGLNIATAPKSGTERDFTCPSKQKTHTNQAEKIR